MTEDKLVVLEAFPPSFLMAEELALIASGVSAGGQACQADGVATLAPLCNILAGDIEKCLCYIHDLEIEVQRCHERLGESV